MTLISDDPWVLGDWISTFSGRCFWPLDPKVEDLSLMDIAHSLSMQCRYTGHTRVFYSVAQHSCLVARECSKENQKVGLLHDAPEAYITDLARPIKRFMPEYVAVENRIWQAVARRWQLPHVIPDEVKAIDNAILEDERMQLMRPNPHWTSRGEGLEIIIKPWDQARARENFLGAFDHIEAGGDLKEYIFV